MVFVARFSKFLPQPCNNHLLCSFCFDSFFNSILVLKIFLPQVVHNLLVTQAYLRSFIDQNERLNFLEVIIQSFVKDGFDQVKHMIILFLASLSYHAIFCWKWNCNWLIFECFIWNNPVKIKFIALFYINHFVSVEICWKRGVSIVNKRVIFGVIYQANRNLFNDKVKRLVTFWSRLCNFRQHFGILQRCIVFERNVRDGWSTLKFYLDDFVVFKNALHLITEVQKWICEIWFLTDWLVKGHIHTYKTCYFTLLLL